MSKIRSALEIALERTESVESNPQRIEEETLTKEGQRLVSKYLYEHALTLEEIQEELSGKQPTQRKYLISGIAHALTANISIPQSGAPIDHLPAIKTAVETLAPDDEMSEQFNRIEQFFQQYQQQTAQIRSSLEQQYEPKLRQKQQQYAQQYGRMVELTFEQDPEFLELLNKHIQQLDEQYRSVLDEVKDQIKNHIIQHYSASS